MYTDPSGEFFWIPMLIGAAIFGTGNLIAHAIRGDIHLFGDGLKYFGQGALAGAALGVMWAYAPAFIHTAMSFYAKVQIYGAAFNAVVGAARGIFTGNWSSFDNSGKLFLGNFYIDENSSFLGGAGQGFLRHTWEMFQTGLGQMYSQIRNIGGNVDRVDYMGGATFATNENSENYNGVTMGNVSNMNLRGEITGDFETYATQTEPMYMHEYGHYLQSRDWGVWYLPCVGLPSGLNAWWDDGLAITHYKGNSVSNPNDLTHHSIINAETGANRRASRYFRKNYGVNWQGPRFNPYPFSNPF